MLAENLPEKIGLDKNSQETYYKYKEMLGAAADEYAKAYMNGEITQQQALEALYEKIPADIHKYTADLVFLFECSGYLFEKYKEAGLSETLFTDTMRDIKYKFDKCVRIKGIFGIFTTPWFDGFFKMTRFAFGRLQYDVTEFEKDEKHMGYAFKKGGLCLSCHIPASGPLKQELCTQSLKMAYEFFKDRLTTAVLPVKCFSWLLYPPYLSVFHENTNTGRFVRDFEILNSEKHDGFGDAWRIFGKDFDGDANNLPSDTTMQKNFVQYIKNGGSFGSGTGILLFDGEKIVKN